MVEGNSDNSFSDFNTKNCAKIGKFHFIFAICVQYKVKTTQPYDSLFISIVVTLNKYVFVSPSYWRTHFPIGAIDTCFL